MVAGIPTIIKPFFGDQFFWADRVEALGIGSSVRKLTADALSEALVQATTCKKQIDRARLVGERIRSVSNIPSKILSSEILSRFSCVTMSRRAALVPRLRPYTVT